MTTSSVTSTPSPSPTPTALHSTTQELSTRTPSTKEPPNTSHPAVPNTAAAAPFTSEEASDEAAYSPTTSEQEFDSFGLSRVDLTHLEATIEWYRTCLTYRNVPHDTLVSVIEDSLIEDFVDVPDGLVRSVLSKYNLGPDLGWTVQRKARNTTERN